MRVKLFSFQSFQVVLLLFTGTMAILFLIEAVRFLPVRADNMYPEAAGVLSAQRWASGLPLYEDYRKPPYLITAFPPVWYAVLAIAAKAGISDLNSLTLFGRMFSLACLAGILGLAYDWNRRIGVSATTSVLAPAFYLSFPILIPWAVTARPDLPALFLGLLALYCVSLRSSLFYAGVSGVFAGMSFLARHNEVSVPIAVVLWLVYRRKWKEAGVFCAMWGTVVGGTLVAFQITSHGMLLLNLSGGSFGTLAVSYVRDIAGRLFLTPGHGFALALFAFGFLGFVECWKADERTRLFGIYLIASLGLILLATAARGAAVNHYLEPAIALAVLVPTGIAHLRSGWKSESASAAFAMIILLVVLLPSVDMQRSYVKQERPNDLQSLARLTSGRQVFTDIPYLAARSTLTLLEPASLLNTEMGGRWNSWSSERIADKLQNKVFDVVILSERADTPYNPALQYPRYIHLDASVRNAINQNYGLCFQLETSYVRGESEVSYVYSPRTGDGRRGGTNSCISTGAVLSQAQGKSSSESK